MCAMTSVDSILLCSGSVHAVSCGLFLFVSVLLLFLSVFVGCLVLVNMQFSLSLSLSLSLLHVCVSILVFLLVLVLLVAAVCDFLQSFSFWMASLPSLPHLRNQFSFAPSLNLCLAIMFGSDLLLFFGPPCNSIHSFW